MSYINTIAADISTVNSSTTNLGVGNSYTFTSTNVIWFTVDTDTNNSEIDLRFSLNEYQAN